MNSLKNLEKMKHFFKDSYLKPYLVTFINVLSAKGFTISAIKDYYLSVYHFGAWLQKKSIPIENISSKTVNNFFKHRCYCISRHHGKTVSRRYANRIKHFLDYLKQQNIIDAELFSTRKIMPPLFFEFIDSLRQRNLSPNTVIYYLKLAPELVELLGNNPKDYNVTKIRNIFINLEADKNISKIKHISSALRVYLRFLAMKGLCVPDLDSIVPAVASWKLSSLPKFISENKIESIIAACNTNTKQGLRDRAIILLLARLALRGSDVVNLQLEDINWQNSTIQVIGKNRRKTKLPLPQDVGDAILAYLTKVRPTNVDIKQLFLCLNAPYRSFSTSVAISDIVRAGLARAGITDAPSQGAHLFRYSVATNLLRNGANLESISALLRHSSTNMTAYYAKIDFQMLKQIAQPWPDGAPC
jgi:integrase/recombinase XerD